MDRSGSLTLRAVTRTCCLKLMPNFWTPLVTLLQRPCGSMRISIAGSPLTARIIAKFAAERVAGSGKPFALHPMSATDRRLIHLALKDQPGVRTESQGIGATRHI